VRLGHVLQARCDVDRIAQRGEHGMIAEADVADDDFAAVNADSELHRLLQFAGQLVIHVFDVRGDDGCGADCLAACGRSDAKAHYYGQSS